MPSEVRTVMIGVWGRHGGSLWGISPSVLKPFACGLCLPSPTRKRPMPHLERTGPYPWQE